MLFLATEIGEILTVEIEDYVDTEIQFVFQLLFLTYELTHMWFVHKEMMLTELWSGFMLNFSQYLNVCFLTLESITDAPIFLNL